MLTLAWSRAEPVTQLLPSGPFSWLESSARASPGPCTRVHGMGLPLQPSSITCFLWVLSWVRLAHTSPAWHGGAAWPCVPGAGHYPTATVCPAGVGNTYQYGQGRLPDGSEEALMVVLHAWRLVNEAMSHLCHWVGEE